MGKDSRKVFIIRHAKALERSAWSGDDCDRPLTKEGEREFKKVAKTVRKIFPSDVTIISSPCERALKTAKILSKLLKRKVTVDPLLSPDASAKDYLEVLKKVKGNVILVGHEDDISSFLSAAVLIDKDRISVKKGGIVFLKQTGKNFKLQMLISPKLVLKILKGAS